MQLVRFEINYFKYFKKQTIDYVIIVLILKKKMKITVIL